jgi:protease-4
MQQHKQRHPAIWALLGVIVGLLLPLVPVIALIITLTISLDSLANQQTPTVGVIPTHVSGPASGPAVALIDIDGPILSDTGSPPTSLLAGSIATPDTIIPLIEQANDDADVAAIVIRMNTPGGAVVPSDQIYHALNQVDKPVVVLMGDLAASGGYYIGMAADHIVANQHTFTGSIGVRLGSITDVSEALERLGIDVTTIHAGEFKDTGAFGSSLSMEEQAYLQSLVDDAHDGFVAVVAEGRGMSEQQVRAEVATGRIFTGNQAYERGLVDALGYQSDAVAAAAELAGIDDEPRVLHYAPAPGSFFDELVTTGVRALVQEASSHLQSEARTPQYR